jgi:uncharacterized membrane protein
MTSEVSRIEESVTVDVPLSTAYDQWTQFEEFPHFMEGVEYVRQLDDTHLQWCATIGGKRVEWLAEILEQIPDSRIAWRSTGGSRNSGLVSFAQEASGTRVTLRVDYAPDGMVENIGDALGIVRRRVKGDLERFKEFIERRGVETGAWRGRVPDQVPTR